MSKNTSILLGDHFEAFVAKQVKSGKFTSVSEVIRAALRLFEVEETKKDRLIKELKKGEQSGFIPDFDRDSFMNDLHRKNARKG
ncbi:MAG: type II toxin-antitoxin system ParD family antitoxin [Flavobacteriales bacterium]|nr:type II toxin-antitoxin system ParD family antitoxin [Flavobacteriales bacterium]MCB0793119.1 type II toxin-antitoxin system ParD family antitoxin [Flavobacteriales bacterium]